MAETDKGIVHLSEPSLDDEIADLCKWSLKHEANGMPIVWMKQSRTWKRNWVSLYRQLLAGLSRLTTKYVSIAEHDCLYSQEHLAWIPPEDDVFYYNENHWLLQWKSTRPELDGMFSRRAKRYALSQIACNRELLLRTVAKRLELIAVNIVPEGEFGAMQLKYFAESGRPVHLQDFFKDKQKADMFKTECPNVDIRHSKNFSGPKRGKKRCYRIPYWGTLEDVKGMMR